MFAVLESGGYVKFNCAGIRGKDKYGQFVRHRAHGYGSYLLLRLLGISWYLFHFSWKFLFFSMRKRTHLLLLFDRCHGCVCPFWVDKWCNVCDSILWLLRPLLSLYLLWRDITMGLGMDRFDCCHHSNVQSGCNRVTGLCFVLVCRPVLYPQRDASQV